LLGNYIGNLEITPPGAGRRSRYSALWWTETLSRPIFFFSFRVESLCTLEGCWTERDLWKINPVLPIFSFWD